MIRNFVLMRLPEREQTRLYENYWSRIEDLFRGSERTFDAFIRDYVALTTNASKQEKSDQIYFAFRRTFGALSSDTSQLESFLGELLRFGRYYAAFSIGTAEWRSLQEPLARVRRQVDVPAVLVMRLFDCFDRAKTLSEDAFHAVLNAIESYVFRRAICGEQTRGYWQIFANIAYRVAEAKPLENVLVALARQRDSYRFPSDSEFRQALEHRDIYGLRVCFDLLERLENHGSKEVTDTTNYSIEHVMPQNDELRPEWRVMLGENWREVHREWLHRLGNLTLTGYNSTYSDRTFDAKKTIPKGFSESAVRLNKFVREQPQWTMAEMKERGERLATRALSVWPPLIVDRTLVSAEEQREMRETARQRDVGKVKMNPKTRELFEALRSRLLAADSDVIELPGLESISYHGPVFFLEVLPRKHRLNLLLALDFNEVNDPGGIARDTSQRKFFVNAVHEGGVYVAIDTLEDVDRALPLIRQAHARTSS